MMVERIETPVGKLPCMYGMGALIALERKTKRKFSEISAELQSGEISLELTVQLIWVGFENGARKANVKFAYADMDVADWMDADPDLARNCLELLTESMSAKSDTSEGNGQAGEAMAPKK